MVNASDGAAESISTTTPLADGYATRQNLRRAGLRDTLLAKLLRDETETLAAEAVIEGCV